MDIFHKVEVAARDACIANGGSISHHHGGAACPFFSPPFCICHLQPTLSLCSLMPLAAHCVTPQPYFAQARNVHGNSCILASPAKSTLLTSRSWLYLASFDKL